MSVHMVIELRDREGAQTVVQALDAYKARLRAGIARTKQRLAAFESRYGVDTARFLLEMTAEDLTGGDLEYVEWAGEARRPCWSPSRSINGRLCEVSSQVLCDSSQGASCTSASSWM